MELNTRIQVRTNSELKERATRTLDRMGIDMPTAINMFLNQVVHDQELPFQPHLTPYADAILEAEAEETITVRDLDELMDVINRA
ncbi:addiction module antitoxin, RelB/DinJ family [Actinomyces bovis]|uniref:Addiction module antitoxin, RelB/DinJ family n=1 Tax=Actinomyces bovis TaxID=1658 RepID=A0ABY1VKW1_9ACTO|nr:type II toxin-antitoxin system RelB/DinJ family antitoxin [Actinomyces bovis]SPT52744.1 addiction module antitoxin, RelB/DinJ family [Actinomyces bovis]VEG54733.1 addiction module antitoxin, RelB/DinJ family [Actinomyces israelii]